MVGVAIARPCSLALGLATGVVTTRTGHVTLAAAFATAATAVGGSGGSGVRHQD